jgi:hypothetical protein
MNYICKYHTPPIYSTNQLSMDFELVLYIELIIGVNKYLNISLKDQIPFHYDIRLNGANSNSRSPTGT